LVFILTASIFILLLLFIHKVFCGRSKVDSLLYWLEGELDFHRRERMTEKNDRCKIFFVYFGKRFSKKKLDRLQFACE